MDLTVGRVIAVVVGVAVGGGVLGGLFGLGAGLVAPDLFEHALEQATLEPVGAAAVLGAAAGVVLGGGLGAFAVTVQVVVDWMRQRERLSGGEGCSGEDGSGDENRDILP